MIFETYAYFNKVIFIINETVQHCDCAWCSICWLTDLNTAASLDRLTELSQSDVDNYWNECQRKWFTITKWESDPSLQRVTSMQVSMWISSFFPCRKLNLLTNNTALQDRFITW